MNRRELIKSAALTAAATCTLTPPLCAEGDWLLVFRWEVNLQEDFEGPPIYVTRENFNELRFPSEEAAYEGAKLLRQTGVELPTLSRFGRYSNVIPESITPMPHLLAVQLGIKPVR